MKSVRRSSVSAGDIRKEECRHALYRCSRSGAGVFGPAGRLHRKKAKFRVHRLCVHGCRTVGERADKQEIDLLLVSENVLTDRIRELKKYTADRDPDRGTHGRRKGRVPCCAKIPVLRRGGEGGAGLLCSTEPGKRFESACDETCCRADRRIFAGQALPENNLCSNLWMDTGQKGRTLLISFDTFSDFSRLFQRSFSYDLADILYYYRNDSCWYEQAAHMLESIDGLDIIASVRLSGGYMGVKGGRYRRVCPADGGLRRL